MFCPETNVFAHPTALQAHLQQQQQQQTGRKKETLESMQSVIRVKPAAASGSGGGGSPLHTAGARKRKQASDVAGNSEVKSQDYIGPAFEYSKKPMYILPGEHLQVQVHRRR